MTIQRPQDLPPPPPRSQGFLGGPPLAVLFRLILLCVIVGVILHALGFDPGNIVDSIRRMIQAIWDMGFDAVLWMWRYFLLGAIIVVPIWIIMRLVRSGGR